MEPRTPDLKRFMTEKTVIVADSAAMSGKPLEAIKGYGLRVVSRFPETFALCRVLTPSEVLRACKGQAAIENRFRFLKNPYFVGLVDLKLPQRVKALGYVKLMTLLAYSLFEWSVRGRVEAGERALSRGRQLPDLPAPRGDGAPRVGGRCGLCEK